MTVDLEVTQALNRVIERAAADAPEHLRTG